MTSSPTTTRRASTACRRASPGSSRRQLITQKGFRNSYARDDAVPSQLTEDELGRLIHSRLVRLEERYGTARIELSHDVLTGVVRDRRDRRAAEEERATLAARIKAERAAAEERERALVQERLDEKRKRLQSERAERRFRWLSIGLAVLLLAVSTLGIISYNFYREAQQQRGLAFSYLMSGQAGQIVDQQPQLAILLGLESLSAARDADPVAPAPLVAALARTTHASDAAHRAHRRRSSVWPSAPTARTSPRPATTHTRYGCGTSTTGQPRG